MKNIIFFNHFHNGDVFLSRTFIKKLIDHIKKNNPEIKFFYAHKNNPLITLDITQLNINPNLFINIRNEHLGDFRLGNDLFINTWYASDKRFYMNQYGISFDCLYALFEAVCKRQLQFSLSDISIDPKDFFPEINYAFYNILNVANWVNNNKTKKIFISNCEPLSGQAHNIDLTTIAFDLAKKYNNYSFILTNKTPKKLDNVFYSSDIIQSKGFDLNENSYLSTFCDVIIGPASGAFTFAMNKTNFFNRSTKIIALCNLIPNKPGKFWLSKMFEDKINYSANVIVSNESNKNNIISLIEQEL